MSSAFVILGALFFLGHSLWWVFNRTKIPDLLLFIAVGILVGPVSGLITPEDFNAIGPFLAELALVVILLEGSLEFSISQLRDASVTSLKITFGAFFLFVPLAAGLTAGLTTLPWPMALYAAIALGSTSSALVIPLVKRLPVNERTRTILMLESSVNDVLVVVLGVIALEIAASGGVGPFDAAMTLLPAVVASLLVGAGFGLSFAFVKRYSPPLSHIRFSTEISVLMGYGVAGLMGLNGALAVLSMGLVLGNLGLLTAKLRQHFQDDEVLPEAEKDLLAELTFLLRVYFFIYMGVVLRWDNPENLGLAVLLTALVFLTRYLVARLFLPFKAPKLDALTVFAMGPRGLACAVVAGLAAQRGVTGGSEVQQLVFSVIPLTLLLTSCLLFVSERFSRQLPLFRSYARSA